MNLLKRSGRFFIPRRVRNWLRSPRRTAEWVWNEFQFGIGRSKTVEFRPGWLLVYHPAAFRFAYFAQQNDADQVMELDGFIGQCRSGMVLFDIGAHFGLFSLAALHYGGETAKAVAVDPSPAACRMMRIQAKLNGVWGRFGIIQACLSSRTGWQAMVQSGVQGAGYFVPPSKDHSRQELTRTQSITLDVLSKRIQSPTHVKIDVEGSEEEVLRGGQITLGRKDGPLLFLELHNEIVRNRGRDPKKVLYLLEDFGYGTFTTDGMRLDHPAILSRPLIRITAKKK